jgi:hypothetical protein
MKLKLKLKLNLNLNLNLKSKLKLKLARSYPSCIRRVFTRGMHLKRDLFTCNTRGKPNLKPKLARSSPLRELKGGLFTCNTRENTKFQITSSKKNQKAKLKNSTIFPFLHPTSFYERNAFKRGSFHK